MQDKASWVSFGDVSTPEASGMEVFAFGPFQLAPALRQLWAGRTPVRLGGRAYDLLVALASRTGAIVDHRELVDAVWNGAQIEDSNLRFQVGQLRRALAAHTGGVDYISSVPGRGYHILGPVRRLSPDPSRDRTGSAVRSSLPARVGTIIGRDHDIEAVLQRLDAQRLVTVVGPGGGGKTTVAIAAAHRLAGAIPGPVAFIDLAPIEDEALVASAVAAGLGIPVGSSDPAPEIIGLLAEQSGLLLLDNCEHVLNSAALLIERILSGAPLTRILATGREPCRVAGEDLYWLPPLAVPPQDAPDVRSYPAVQLFEARARFQPWPADGSEDGVALIADICRDLDGLPLAIELVAARAGALGLGGVATMIRQGAISVHFTRRTAQSRQRTLQATFDWSYGLLTADEAHLLRALSVFRGPFSREAAVAVASAGSVPASAIISGLGSLVEKTLVMAETVAEPAWYRLLKITRDFAFEKMTGTAGEFATAAPRHARFYADLLEQAVAGRRMHPGIDTLEPASRQVGNIRAALAWCFGPDGDTLVGARLAAGAAPLFLRLLLPAECVRWAAVAEQHGAGLAQLSPSLMLEWRFARGVALRFTRADNEETLRALGAALQLAEEAGDAGYQLWLTESLFVSLYRTGDATRARAYAAHLARGGAGVIGLLTAGWMLGQLDTQMGRYREALQHCDTALHNLPRQRRPEVSRFVIDQRLFAGCNRAQLLWTLGFPSHALVAVDGIISEVEALGHPVFLSNVYSWTVPVLIRTGEYERAQTYAEAIGALARRHALGPFLALSHCYRGKLATLRGRFAQGLEELEGGLQALAEARNMLLDFATAVDFAEALAEAGHAQWAFDRACELIDRIARTGMENYRAEAWRIKGLALARLTPGDADGAEEAFRTALRVARSQGATSSALRAAIDLGHHLKGEGRRDEALAELRKTYSPFTEGFETCDLQRARTLIAVLSGSGPKTLASG